LLGRAFFVINGNSNAIVWALSHPISVDNPGITLYASNPEAGGTTLKAIFMAVAGSWPNPPNNANQVPVVARGEFFVPSSKQIADFRIAAAAEISPGRRDQSRCKEVIDTIRIYDAGWQKTSRLRKAK
jgi:hypothetical protein